MSEKKHSWKIDKVSSEHEVEQAKKIEKGLET